MSEVQQQGKPAKGDHKVRSKKQSTKIDMTPMVDLAFLLLTFFMLTTTFAKPKTMEIAVPEKPKDMSKPPEVNEKRVMNLILGEKDKVFWWMGITKPEVNTTNFSKEGIRKVVLEQTRNVGAIMKGLGKDPDKFPMVILIKPVDKSKFKNFVDIMDEMKITQSKIYALVPITPDDLALIKDK